MDRYKEKHLSYCKHCGLKIYKYKDDHTSELGWFHFEGYQGRCQSSSPIIPDHWWAEPIEAFYRKRKLKRIIKK
jgi:hypothetical protein